MTRKQSAVSRLTLEDIFSNRVYDQKGFGPVRWMKDDAGYSTLEGEKAKELIRYDAQSGARTVLVSADQLNPEGKADPIEIADYEWSTDNKKLLIFTNTERVWRHNTRGDYWVLDFGTGQLSQLGKGRPPKSLMFAKFSPDGRKVAYVSEQNIYVEKLASGKAKKLTRDGGGPIVNGIFDWVYEEELDCRDGFRWSPDGKTIAFWRSDTSDIGTFYLVDNLSGVYSKPIPLPYPKVGAKLSSVTIGVVSAKGGPARWLEIPGDPADHYLARMEFIPRSHELMIQQLNREQNTLRVWIADTKSQSLTNILTETDNAFLDIHDNTRWLEGESWFTWTSERDGWRKLYRVSRDGAQILPITTDDFDIVRIACIDPLGGYVYAIASPENFTERHLYRSRIDGSGPAERVTPVEMPGQHAYQMSGNAEWAIHTYSHSASPNRIDLVRVADHKAVKLLQDNRPLRTKLGKLKLSTKEFLSVDIGGETLDAYMIKPADFDPARKHPVVFFVYGEPAGATVQNHWEGAGGLWHQYLAQQGYAVVSVDNRGTASPRGRAWRKSIYRQIGILASEDQAKVARELLRRFPFLDASRVGIWGWSGGGQMTLNCLFRYPEIYKAGIAVSFVADQKLYDATYQERYMGLIESNPNGYRDGSPIHHAKYLQGKLLIVHGTADDNVHYQSFEMLADELIRHNKLFSMMAYPMRAHGISEGDNTSLHLRRTMEMFWNEQL
ncbi:MAG: S9 family peptidase [Fimbriimonas sp.]|nr:S9 family peptidase [Fimbriimonas sp.]